MLFRSEHLAEHMGLYGEYTGVRSARKHLGWYVRDWPGSTEFRQRINAMEGPKQQMDALHAYLDEIESLSDRVPSATSHATISDTTDMTEST